MQQFPTSQQNFERIISDNFLYIDKTMYIYELLQENNMLFFARPRRFGKSMMISTLKAIYQGKKHLFENLWIYDKIDWEATARPVIHLDFTKVSYNSDVLSLEKGICVQLDEIAQEYNVYLNKDEAKYKFAELLQHFKKQGKTAVLLVDEYDMPLTDALDTPQMKEILNLMANFYGTLKGYDELIHQALLTGVSKFGKVSLFSKLNNLIDISMEDKYLNMCGFTQEELEENFQMQIVEVAKYLNMSEKRLWKKIKEEYNGYSWNGKDKVYCPFLIMKFFRHQKFGNYWFETGTPTILLKLLRKEGILPFELEEVQSEDGLLSNMDIYGIDIIGMLFQTGYLTVKRAKMREGETTYFLSYPNNEVRRAFEKQILADYLGIKEGYLERNYIYKLRNALNNNDIDSFIKICQSAFASIAYQQIANNDEDAFHAIMHLLVKLTGERVVAEVPHNVLGLIISFSWKKEPLFWNINIMERLPQL